MPGRYEMVEEPSLDGESLADEVYQPDQSIPDHRTRPHIRSLEPIIANPISLKTVFMDPRWSEGQRRSCLCALGAVAVLCLILLVTLLAGLGKVLSHISWMERMSEHGLTMVPDLGAMMFTAFLFTPTGKATPWRHIFEQSLNATVATYEVAEHVGVYTDCSDGGPPPEGKHCRFPLSAVLKGACTPANRFGYAEGRPCILFRFKHEQEWLPEDADKRPLKFLPLSCQASLNGQRRLDLNYTAWPKEGFDTRFFKKGEALEDENGKTYYNQLPLVMVQFLNLEELFQNAQGLPIQVQCRLGATERAKLRPKNFYGIRVVEFDVRLVDEILG